MARNITQYDLLISCPGDVANAVGVIKDVVEEFNQQFGDALGINIRWRYWQNSVYAESGGKPQDLLNKQIVDTSDLAVAIFKTRFGSPTDNYGSGTEEEIERMLAVGRQVFMFFDESPVRPSDFDMNEYQRVQEFKGKYKDKGIFWTYKNEDEFRDIFRAHITRYFMTLSNGNATEGKSDLIVRAYKDGRVEEKIQLSPFDMGGFISSKKLIQEIEDGIHRISEIKLVRSSEPISQALGIFMGKKVEIESHTIDIIGVIAEKIGIKLPEDFFDIGNLTETSALSNPLLGGKSINGTVEEKTKYNSIVSLEKLIHKTLGHMQMEKYYKDLYGVELVLFNDGTKYDEDIDIDIVMPMDRFIDIKELPVPTEEVNLGDDWRFGDIFEIPATKDFVCYSDTRKTLMNRQIHVTPSMPFTSRDYEEEYRETLRNVFDYQLYADGNNMIIKVHFDYIKQHQAAAFPTWIFVKEPKEELLIKYSITTKNNKDVIERELSVRGCEG